MEDLIQTQKHHDLIYDIGMHRGEDTEFYLRKGFRVVAFEANPELICFCSNRLKKFIDQGQLIIIEGAIVDLAAVDAGQKKVQFYKNDNYSFLGTVCSNWANRNTRSGNPSRIIEVEVINFASILQEHGVPYFMKIDIEGCDMHCLDSLEKFQERPDYVSIESDKISFANIKSEIATFMRLGYNCFQAVEQSGLYQIQSPPQRPKEGKYVAQQFEPGSSGLFGSELGDNWKSKHGILWQYRFIQLGYYFLGTDGIMNSWKFRGAWRLRSLTRYFLTLFTKAEIPGWYDTHARHSSIYSREVSPIK